ncbi:Ger(x)C family spore germination protein [Paenibacillus glycinis]|uniref:Ger(X)C family spore germination protein n=1 Tax=Paenibacillus glycinis TaxID=2697035 RepID=A0ABW9XW05_9BACL|nr:Ger(x)C family spore germination protein [Paenibacillus glycinis]NBD26889.1 Ger(x)C family spore germination protein [Paenibacillus glycinis]
MAASAPWIRAIGILISAAALSACSNQQIINKINLAQTGSYDLAGDRVKTAVVIGEYFKKGETKIVLLDTESRTAFDMIPKLHAKSHKTVQYGQLRMIMFGRSFAGQGIGSILENFFRDSKVSSKLQLAVAEGEASKLLAATLRSNDPLYAMNLIEDNMRYGNLPHRAFQDTLFDYFGEGRDFYLPSLALDRGELNIGGIALFKGEAYRDRIGINEAFILKLLVENARDGSYTMPVPNARPEEALVIRCISSKTRMRLLRKAPVPAVELGVKLNVVLKDIPRSLRVATDRDLARLESGLEQELKGSITAFIARCVKLDVDPVGFGDFVRSRTRGWKEKPFYAAYPSLRTDVKVDLRITQAGVGKLGNILTR